MNYFPTKSQHIFMRNVQIYEFCFKILQKSCIKSIFNLVFHVFSSFFHRNTTKNYHRCFQLRAGNGSKKNCDAICATALRKPPNVVTMVTRGYVTMRHNCICAYRGNLLILQRENACMGRLLLSPYFQSFIYNSRIHYDWGTFGVFVGETCSRRSDASR